MDREDTEASFPAQSEVLEPLFELDLSEALLPERFHRNSIPKIILCRLSQHELDLDVLIPEVSSQLRKLADHPGRMDLPVGFRLGSLPLGAVLRRLR